MDEPDDLMQDRINALVDGQLSPAQQTQTLAQLAEDPAAQQTLASWQAQRIALRTLHRSLLDEPVPATLLAAAQRGHHGHRQIGRWARWGGIAATVMLSFGIGWFAHEPRGGQAGAPLAGRPASVEQAFVRQASVAHAVFAPELRHPVEVSAAQQDHLVQWLSKRLGKPLKVPVLTAQGYELIGGRLLPGEAGSSGARAQFMFQNAAGLRLTLYLGALDSSSAAGDAGAGTGQRETAFRYSADGPVPAFYWVDGGFGYALSGPVSQAELMRIAELVYRQL